MMILALTFYLFAGILVLSALMVIFARNAVHSVLFLILAFFNAAGLFVLLGAEFAAMILVIVYVGAVAVLFLFVVMMLDVNTAGLRKGLIQYVPLAGLLGGVLLFQLVMLYQTWQTAPNVEGNALVPTPDPDQIENTRALGQVLYTDYVYAFQGVGLILLVAMIGAIVLTLRVRPGVKKQKVANQFARNPDDVMEVKKITPGTGV